MTTNVGMQHEFFIKGFASNSMPLINFNAHGLHQIRPYVDALVAKMYNDRDVI